MNSALALQPIYYRLSGRVSPLAVAVGLPLCLAAATILGFLFGLLEFLGHVVGSLEFMCIGEILLLIVAGGVIGYLPIRVFNRFHSRSRLFNRASLAAVALLFLYCAWAGWIFHYLLYFGHRINPLFLLFPRSIVSFMAILYPAGSWGFAHETIKGPFLALVWICEAAVILGVAFAVAEHEGVPTVFCEHCKRWGNRRTVMQFRDVKIAEIKSALLANNFDALSSVSPRDLEEDCWCSILLEGCPACDNSQTLTFQRTLFFRQQHGRTSTKNTSLIHRLLLTPEQTAKIAVIAASLEPPSEPAA